MKLVIELSIFDEALLRNVASSRMSEAGFEPDPSIHVDAPLAQLAFEALIGSNTDQLAPIEMGLEITNWSGLPEK